MGLFWRPRRPILRLAAGAATAGIAYHAGHAGPSSGLRPARRLRPRPQRGRTPRPNTARHLRPARRVAERPTRPPSLRSSPRSIALAS